jgi:hypothetical protein
MLAKIFKWVRNRPGPPLRCISMQMNMKQVGRLLKFGAHLKTEKLRWINLDFDNPKPTITEPFYPSDEPGKFAITVYYWALIQLAHLWPEHFAYDAPRSELKSQTGNIVDDTIDFFGLTAEEFMHVFVPTMQAPSTYGGKELAFGARPSDLAENIYDLVSRRLTMFGMKKSQIKNITKS